MAKVIHKTTFESYRGVWTFNTNSDYVQILDIKKQGLGYSCWYIDDDYNEFGHKYIVRILGVFTGEDVPKQASYIATTEKHGYVTHWFANHEVILMPK